MLPQLVMIVVVEPFDGRVLDRTVHTFDLTVGPGMVDLGEAMIDAVFPPAHREYMGYVSCRRAFVVTRLIAELDTVVGQNGVNL